MRYIQPQIFKLDDADVLKYRDCVKDTDKFVCRSDLLVAFGETAELAFMEYLHGAAVIFYGNHRFTGLFGGMPTYKTINQTKFYCSSKRPSSEALAHFKQPGIKAYA